MKIFFLVLSRDDKFIDEKIEELKSMGVPYVIVCGKQINHPNVVYRKPLGKYDAINFGFNFIPENTDIVVLNDVDTKIFHFQSALNLFRLKKTSLVFSRVLVKEGPQNLFYKLLDRIRNKLLIAASGEMMLIKHNVLKEIIPLKPCKAEDSYILFKILENKHNVIFSEKCYVETVRTKSAEEEMKYKRRTVCGIYQAIAHTRPPLMIKLFYLFLPIFSPILLVLGKKGYFWMKGILLAFCDYLRGDWSGVWISFY
jgi:hypothetical protein